MSGVGVTVDSGNIRYVGEFARMWDCSQAVLESYSDAWAALMANPFPDDELQNETTGTFRCEAVLGNPLDYQLPIVESPQHFLCVLKGMSR